MSALASRGFRHSQKADDLFIGKLFNRRMSGQTASSRPISFQIGDWTQTDVLLNIGRRRKGSRMNRLEGKVALVSGGTTGMGAAIAKRFQAEGATVVATGTNPETLEKAKKELPGVEFVASDASDIEAIRALVEKLVRDHGRIDILAANAGTAGYVPVGKVEPDFFDRIFDLNTKGAYFLLQEVVSVMPDGGSIVLTSSIAHAMAMPNNSVYAASKAALRSMGRTFAGEFASRGIRVNTISPGPIVTPIWTKLTGATGEELRAMENQIAAKVPMKRAGRPEDIAGAALFLASDDSVYVTGVDLPVDGGVMAIGFI
jgi:NAD(P)-dependent dehydrogenase (short-subunit alcohol dehydrogenase family)